MGRRIARAVFHWGKNVCYVVVAIDLFEFFDGEDFPVLYGWKMQSNDNSVTKWTRNPYYFKVDANGQHLPYIDYVESTYVENDEIITMTILIGGVDCAQAAVQKHTTLVENPAHPAYLSL